MEYIDERTPINWPVKLTKRQWDLINIALIKVENIGEIPGSPFKDDWEYLYKLSKDRGSCPDLSTPTTANEPATREGE